MRISLITLFIVFGFSVTAQNWSVTTIPHGRDIYDVHIFNQAKLAIAGGNLQNDALQSVFMSNNSGLTWDVNYDYIAPMINAIDFFDDSVGFAVGNEGILLKTTDCGQNWTSVNSGITRQLNDVKYLNDSTLIAVGGSAVYQTIMTSTDNGNTWTIQLDVVGRLLQSVCFIDEQNGTAVGANTILKTSDGGLNWIPVSTPIIRDFNSVTFANSAIGYIAGGDTAGTVNRTILKTVNGGNSWSIILDENAAQFNDIYFLNTNTGYVVGDSSKVMKTTDGGNNWVNQNLNTMADSLRLNCVKFLNENYGVIGSRFGSVFIFSTISPVQVTTSGAVVTNMVDANMAAIIDGNGNEFVYTFLFDLDSNLTNYSETFDAFAVNNVPSVYSVNIPNLQNDTIYYYTIKARNIAGTVYGDTIPFYTGSIFLYFQTEQASNITTTEARLNGIVSQLELSTNIVFEYGLTPAFGNTVTANPNLINDTLTHIVYADISGLQTDSYYYFRLKGILPNGSAIYGATETLYNGENIIPNWDFQLWNDNSIPSLTGWSFYGDGFEQVAGHEGNYALKISDFTIAILGDISAGNADGDPNFLGGMSFNYRPDSVSFYANYFIENNDTMIFLVKLYSGTNIISMKFNPITGGSDNQFQRLAFEIPYNNGDMPDSLVLGIVPTNPFDTILNLGSLNYIIVDDISFGSSAPVPLNGDFEDWFDYNHERIDWWGNHTYFGDSLIQPIISRSIFEQPNDFAARIKTKLASSGAIISGYISTNNNIFNEEDPDFPVYRRYNSLKGFYKFLPENSDTMEVSVTLFKNGIPIGSGDFRQANTVAEFALFTVNIQYNYPLIVPDSASIKIQAFCRNPKGESEVIIDKLSFDNPDLTVGIDDNTTNDLNAILYPNPGGDILNILLSDYSNQPLTVEIFSVAGVEVYKKIFSLGQLFNISTLNFNEGVYFVKLSSVEGVKIYKWIKT